MKPFDYNNYLKKNPLLKESVNEATIKDLFGPLTTKLESMGYDVDIDPTGGYKSMDAWKVFPDKSSLVVFVYPSQNELNVRDRQGFDDFETVDVTIRYYTDEITKKFFGLFKTRDRIEKKIFDDQEGKNIDLGRGMFEIPIDQSVERIVALVQKAEAKVSQISNTQVRENQISEGGEESQAYEFVSKNYKAMIAPGVEKMLTEFDKKFPKATPQQVAKVTKTILDLAKYQIKVWNQ